MAKEFDIALENGRKTIASGPNRVRPGILLLGGEDSGKTALLATLLDEDLETIEDMAAADWAPPGFPTYPGSDFGRDVNYMDSPDGDIGETFEDFHAYWTEIADTWAAHEKARPLEKPHAVWYCIPATQKRAGRYDYKMLRKLRDDPAIRDRVAVVITQSDKDKGGSMAHGFKENLANYVGDDLPIFRVASDPKLPFEIGALMEWSVERLTDEDVEEAFVASQMQALKRRKKKAKKAIQGFELTTSSLGALHRWDTETLTAAQCSLARRIVHIYGLDDHIHVSAELFSSVITSALEESLAGKVLKRTPIVDALSRECCSAAIAVQITRAIGKAVSKICYRRCVKKIHGEEVDLDAPLDADEILSHTRLAM